MKTPALTLVAVLFLAGPGESATTPSFGYVTVTVPAGSAASPSYTPLAIPLYNNAVFSGAVTSVDSATQITLGGAVWIAGQFATTAAPRFAKVNRLAGQNHRFEMPLKPAPAERPTPTGRA